MGDAGCGAPREGFHKSPTWKDCDDAQDAARDGLNDRHAAFARRRAVQARQPAFSSEGLLAVRAEVTNPWRGDAGEGFHAALVEETAIPPALRSARTGAVVHYGGAPPGPGLSVRGRLRRPDPGRRDTRLVYVHPRFSSSAVPPAGPGFARHVAYTQLANLYQGEWIFVPVLGGLRVALPARERAGAAERALAIQAAPRRHGYVLADTTYVPAALPPADQHLLSY